MTILVTGVAGFIGAATAEALLARGEQVVGFDNLNDYYDVSLKQARLDRLLQDPGFRFVRADLADRTAVAAVFSEQRPDRVIHLAAQAGVRYGMQNPHAYVESNLVGFLNILEGCRRANVGHLVFASSSSVYGSNTSLPYRVGDNVDHPLSLYAASKKANELMAHSYAHLYGVPATGLRFFTVYGPWGRPDMAPFIFTRKILDGEPIEVFNNGDHMRDFTYVDDVVDGVVRALDHVAASSPAYDPSLPDPATSAAPYRLYNLGNSRPVKLLDFIAAIEAAAGREAVKIMRPMQQGDVHDTYADISALSADTGFQPKIEIHEGVRRFVAWYRDFYGVR